MAELTDLLTQLFSKLLFISLSGSLAALVCPRRLPSRIAPFDQSKISQILSLTSAGSPVIISSAQRPAKTK